MNVSINHKNRKLIQNHHPHLVPYLKSDESVSYQPHDHYLQNNVTIPPPGLDEIPPHYQIMYGLGSGTWILNHFQQCPSSLYRFLIVEPDPQIWQEALHKLDFTPLLTNSMIHWYIGDDSTSLENRMREDLAAIGSWGIQVFVNGSSSEAHQTHYEQFRSLVQNVSLLAYENAQVQIQHGLEMQKNIVANLPAMLRTHSLDTLQNRFVDIPAVVIGAGPSLDHNLHHLKQVPSGTLLIAVDTVLPLLRKIEIVPHIVVACDPSKWNMRHFETIGSLDNSCLAFLPETYRGILHKYRNHPHFVCLHDWQSKTLQQLSSVLPSGEPFQRGMNVGFCAFSLAQHLGCSPIILVGMDLAVPSEGLSHVRGSANAVEIDQSKASTRLIQVEGYHGDWVDTYPHFKHVLDRFNSVIPQSRATVIDATEGGARKVGCIQKPLKQGLQELTVSEAIDFQNLIPDKIDPDYTEAIHSITKLAHKLSLAHQQVQQGIHRLEELKERIDHPKTDPETLLIQLQTYQNRWYELLESSELDSTLDIGLAQWRFAYRRAIPPQADPKEQVQWWCESLVNWLESLRGELVEFSKIYQQVLNELKNGLTSTHSGQ